MRGALTYAAAAIAYGAAVAIALVVWTDGASWLTASPEIAHCKSGSGDRVAGSTPARTRLIAKESARGCLYPERRRQGWQAGVRRRPDRTA